MEAGARGSLSLGQGSIRVGVEPRVILGTEPDPGQGSEWLGQ